MSQVQHIAIHPLLGFKSHNQLKTYLPLPIKKKDLYISKEKETSIIDRLIFYTQKNTNTSSTNLNWCVGDPISIRRNPHQPQSRKTSLKSKHTRKYIDNYMYMNKIII